MTVDSPISPVSDRHAERLGQLLLQVRAGLTQVMEQQLAAHDIGLRMSQAQVVLRLGVHGGMTQSEMARSIAMDPGALTRLVDQLVARGWVQRLPHETDRRSVRLALTAEGEQLHKTLNATRMKVMTHVLQHLPEPERERLMDKLDGLLNALQTFPVND